MHLIPHFSTVALVVVDTVRINLTTVSCRKFSSNDFRIADQDVQNRRARIHQVSFPPKPAPAAQWPSPQAFTRSSLDDRKGLAAPSSRTPIPASDAQTRCFQPSLQHSVPQYVGNLLCCGFVSELCDDEVKQRRLPAGSPRPIK